MTRDLRLLPMAGLGWLSCLVAIRSGPLLGALLVLLPLTVAVAAGARMWRPPGGRHRGRTPGRAAATVLLSGVVVALLAGWALARAELRSDAVADALGETAEVTLRIDSEPRPLSPGRLLVRATWLGGARVAVTVLADEDWSDVVVGSRVGARVRVTGTSPGDASAALLVPEGPPTLVARPPPVAAAVAVLRAGLLRACSGLDPQGRGLVPGIAIGDDRELPVGLADDLRTVSLTHVTAVSGAHVALVIGLVLAACTWVPRPGRAVIGAVVLIALVLLVHPAASVLRSAVMGGVLLLGLLLQRPRAALSALWTSVCVLLAVDPWLAGSFGFVLSVLATAGLLLASAPLAERFARWLPRPLALLLAVPVAAQLACLPALALLQPAMPVHGVLANVLAAPAVPPATVLGLAATMVAPASPGLAVLLAGWAAMATAWIAAVATWCAGLPLATVPWWLVVALGLVSLIVVAAVHAVRRMRRHARSRPT